MASAIKNLFNKLSKDDTPINKKSVEDSSVGAKETKADPNVDKKVDDKSPQ